MAIGGSGGNKPLVISGMSRRKRFGPGTFLTRPAATVPTTPQPWGWETASQPAPQPRLPKAAPDAAILAPLAPRAFVDTPPQSAQPRLPRAPVASDAFASSVVVVTGTIVDGPAQQRPRRSLAPTPQDAIAPNKAALVEDAPRQTRSFVALPIAAALVFPVPIVGSTGFDSAMLSRAPRIAIASVEPPLPPLSKTYAPDVQTAASVARRAPAQVDQPLPAVIVVTVSVGGFDSAIPTRPAPLRIPTQEQVLPGARPAGAFDSQAPSIIRPRASPQPDQPLPFVLLSTDGFEGQAAYRVAFPPRPAFQDSPVAGSAKVVVEASAPPPRSVLRAAQPDLPLPSVIVVNIPAVLDSPLPTRPPARPFQGQEQIFPSESRGWIADGQQNPQKSTRATFQEPPLPVVLVGAIGFDSPAAYPPRAPKAPPAPDAAFPGARGWVDLPQPFQATHLPARIATETPLPVVLVGVVVPDSPPGPRPQRRISAPGETPLASETRPWVDSQPAAARLRPLVFALPDAPLPPTAHPSGFDAQATYRRGQSVKLAPEQPLPIVLVGAVGVEATPVYPRPRFVPRSAAEAPLTSLPTGAVVYQDPAVPTPTFRGHFADSLSAFASPPAIVLDPNAIQPPKRRSLTAPGTPWATSATVVVLEDVASRTRTVAPAPEAPSFLYGTNVEPWVPDDSQARIAVRVVTVALDLTPLPGLKPVPPVPPKPITPSVVSYRGASYGPWEEPKRREFWAELHYHQHKETVVVEADSSTPWAEPLPNAKVEPHEQKNIWSEPEVTEDEKGVHLHLHYHEHIQETVVQAAAETTKLRWNTPTPTAFDKFFAPQKPDPLPWWVAPLAVAAVVVIVMVSSDKLPDDE